MLIFKVRLQLLVLIFFQVMPCYGQKIYHGSMKNQYSWARQHAQVLPTGDLKWAPEPFIFNPGSVIRYIDFDNGDDNSDGTTKLTPWKHHPWDAEATGTARDASGIITYVFKRGVIYRGFLNADESGQPGNPIRLTSDPEWGTGEASVFGSIRISGGWTRCNAASAPNIPEPEKVWYKDIGLLANASKVVAELTQSGYNRIYLARSPDFQNTPDEPMKTWWTFTNKQISGGVLNLTDNVNLKEPQVDYYKGGDVWAIEDAVTMATLWRKQIQNYNPSAKTISVSLDEGKAFFGGRDCKYFVENTPFLLDSPGEYWYNKATGRIFVRLEGEKDPNSTVIEIASKSQLMSFPLRSNIEINGLTFGFTTCDNIRYGTVDAIPALMFNNSENITVKNCRFIFLNGGILSNGVGENFLVTDNEMLNMDDFAMLFNGQDKLSILRNMVAECGTRHLGRWYSSIPAIAGGPVKIGEIAGNIIEHAWGSGINFTWGRNDGPGSTVPLVKGFVHHNRVSHSLQGVNDYGGIESWMGGPVFTYNNISEDAQGWHYNWWVGHIMSLGYPFYFDGAFKQYIFNNIVRGTGWNRTAAGYNQVLGFYNMYVHNVAYNIGFLTGSGDGNFAPDGQNFYLANVSDSTEKQFNHSTRESGVPFDSYGNNFFSGNGFKGNFLTNGGTWPGFEFNFSEFCDRLNSFNPDLGQVGYITSKRVFEKPWEYDFRPTAASELIDRGVKFFVPFPLKSVVGEWHFYRHRSDTTLIKGENFYFTSEYAGREAFKNVPKNHMKAYGMASPAFSFGHLEDWTEGAMNFNGSSTYCDLKNSSTSVTVCNNPDMTTNNFIIEVFFRTTASHTGGVIVSKAGATGYGYEADIDATGKPRFSILNNGNAVFSISAAVAVNDGEWHHLLIETNRLQQVVNVYADGIFSPGAVNGTIPATGISLGNSADFTVGKNRNGNYFSGQIDFLRISKGSLADALTTFDELYAWEFGGPFLYDFAGNPPVGRRDAGALERGGKLCNMTVSSRELRFDNAGGIKSLTVNADMGFEVAGTEGTFFTYSRSGNEITVTVPSSSTSEKGEIRIYGCNETIPIKIIRGNPVGINDEIAERIVVKPNPVTGSILNVYIPEGLPVRTARLYSLIGDLMSEHKVYAGDNALEAYLTNGMYFLNLSGKGFRHTLKVVVNR
jgi:hypothetical protein